MFKDALSFKNILWKQFALNDVFTITATQTNEIGKFKPGIIPFICASNLNNGIQGFVEPRNNTQIEAGNCITVSSLDGTSFYQPINFVGRGHGSVSVIRHHKLNKYNALFICACLKKQTVGKYNYSNQLFLNELKKTTIMLPAGQNDEPDWRLMEGLMKRLQKHIFRLSDLLKQELLSCIPVLLKQNEPRWKDFNLADIFEIKKCKGTSKAKLTKGCFPYITRSNINNGLTGYCGNADLINPKNTISIHAEWKNYYCSFYQCDDYVTDGMIAMLISDKLNKYNSIFISTVLNKTKYDGSGLKSSLKKLKLKLPADKFGNPDWKYMENYIKNKKA